MALSLLALPAGWEACQRLSASTFRSMSTTERAETFAQPTIVTGLLDAWPTHADGFGGIATAGGSLHPLRSSTVTNGLSALVASAAAVSNDPAPRQVVGTTQDWDQAGPDALDLRSEIEARFPVPDELRRASAHRVLSIGDVSAMVRPWPNHGFAWMGLVAGTKLWHLAPSDAAVFAPPTCDNTNASSGVEYIERVTHYCVHRTGEAETATG